MQVETGPPINTSIDDPDNQRFKEDDFRMLYMKVWTFHRHPKPAEGKAWGGTGRHSLCDT